MRELTRRLIQQVPKNGELEVKLWDKDENVLADDYIGSFKCQLGNSGSQELEIRGRLGMHHGKFLLNVSSGGGAVTDEI